MADIRIRVGASLDGSPGAVFKSLGDMAKRAKDRIENDLAKTGEPLGRSVKANAKKAEAAMADLRAKLSGQDLMSPGTRSIKQFGDEAAKRFDETKRRFKELSGEVVKGARDIERAERQASKAAAATARRDERDAARSSASFRRGAGRAGMAVARGALNLGTRVASDIAGGAGIDLDLGSHIARNVALESKSVALSSAGYMPDQGGVNATRVDPAKLEAQAREVARATAIAPTEAIDALSAFVSKTGDLETGRAVLKDLALLSKATGASLEDMVDAAGDVSANLGEIPNKGAAIAQVMRTVAGEGKKGAVEIKDLAVHLAKLAAAAPMFEGDVAKNIGLLTAIAEESRQRGGAASAAQATTSVSSFTNTFSKAARLKQFKAFGVETTGAAGATRDPKMIIMDAIRAASSVRHGGIAAMTENMGKMFMEVRARSATRGFETVYRDAYSTRAGTEAEKVAAGMSAVSAEFDRLTSAQMGQTEIITSANSALLTSAARAQLFNNAMDDAVKDLEKGLLPVLQDLTPTIVAVTKALAILAGGDTYDKARAKENEDAIEAANKTAATLEAAQAGATPNVIGPRTMTLAKGAQVASRENEDAVAVALSAARDRLEQTKKERDTHRNIFNPSGMGVDDKDAPTEKAYAAAKAQEERAQAAFDRLHAANDSIAYQLKNGILSVRIIEGRPPAPKVDGKGVPPVSDTEPNASYQ